MKFNFKVINVSLTERECSVLKDLLCCCLRFAYNDHSDSDYLKYVRFIQEHLSDSDKDMVHDLVFKVL